MNRSQSGMQYFRKFLRGVRIGSRSFLKHERMTYKNSFAIVEYRCLDGKLDGEIVCTYFNSRNSKKMNRCKVLNIELHPISKKIKKIIETESECKLDLAKQIFYIGEKTTSAYTHFYVNERCCCLNHSFNAYCYSLRIANKFIAAFNFDKDMWISIP